MPLLGHSGVDSVAVGYDGNSFAAFVTDLVFDMSNRSETTNSDDQILYAAVLCPQSGNIVSFFNIYNSVMGELEVPHHYGKNNHYWKI